MTNILGYQIRALLKEIAFSLVNILFNRHKVTKDSDLFATAMRETRDNLLALATNTAPAQGPRSDLRTTIMECIDATLMAEARLEPSPESLNFLQQIHASLEEVVKGMVTTQ